jgi:hypothetical protein
MRPRWPTFAQCPRTELGVTEALHDRVIGLPVFVDITAAR